MREVLWPLALHPNAEVAEASALCLCRLTWLGKTPTRGSDGDDRAQLPTAEEVIASACSDFFEVFKAVTVSGTQGDSSSAAAAYIMACLHSARLLELMKHLLLCGRSAAPALGGRRDKGGSDDIVVMLPIGKIVGVIDSILTFTLRRSGNSGSDADLLCEARGQGKSLGDIFAEALLLLGALADTAGVSLLPFTSRIRRWLELLLESSIEVHERHSYAICTAVLALAQGVPAVLFNATLLERLIGHALLAMQRIECSMAAARFGNGTSSVPAARRKRKLAEVMGGSGSSATRGATVAAAAPAGLGPRLELFQFACLTLARILNLAAPMIKQQQVAQICEQLVRYLWQGLISSSHDGSGVGAAISDLSVAGANCFWMCRDAPTMLAVLDLLEALHQPPRLGVTPLAPDLVNAFASLLDSLASTHQRRVQPVSRRRTAVDASVRSRALEVRDSLLAVGALSLTPLSNEALGAASQRISISWPEPRTGQPAPLLEAEMADDDMAAEPEEHTAQKVERKEEEAEAVPAGTLQVETSDSAGERRESEAVSRGVMVSDEPLRQEDPQVSSREAKAEPLSKEDPQVSSGAVATASEVPAEIPQQSAKEPSPAKTTPQAVPTTVMAEPAAKTASTAEPAAVLPATTASTGEAGSEVPLELFPEEEGDGSPLPELCMDSPDSDDNRLGIPG
eukprot:gnl/TRDRNA2_/TRDRNA2_91889_c1_seq1.p1 gnl/TRDRNA2_/TRDRNA2_91889_c1~~gnl/TRDRNA2_/TRDRNA2_91889_c1_seq1.p1  ORF type:complete len:736 (-),score=112.43 gnl/TRDRNA2_/TRDRNA2_91889_c1_seq1:73-2118(-)